MLRNKFACFISRDSLDGLGQKSTHEIFSFMENAEKFLYLLLTQKSLEKLPEEINQH